MFHSAAIKLTGWYLGLIMVLSIGCSIALYHISAAQLQRGFNRQQLYLNGVVGGPFGSYGQLRDQQLEEGLHNLGSNLIIFNLGVLLLGGAASYALARRTLAPIEEALEDQSRFTADASHELRTPLTAMKTEIEVALRDKKLSATEARELLESNLEEVEKLRALSDGLLKLARPATESVAEVSVQDVVAGALTRLEKVIQTTRAEVVNNAGLQELRGDRESLTELLVILIDNAIKYSPRDKSVVIRSEQRKNQVWISVTDRGRGIKASDLPYIFNRFYRADTSRSKEQIEGYGLGLSLAKQIAEAHHGSIAVASTPGSGSTFTLRLPLAKS